MGVITISCGCFERCCSNKKTPQYRVNLSFVTLRNRRPTLLRAPAYRTPSEASTRRRCGHTSQWDSLGTDIVTAGADTAVTAVGCAGWCASPPPTVLDCAQTIRACSDWDPAQTRRTLDTGLSPCRLGRVGLKRNYEQALVSLCNNATANVEVG